MPFAGKGGFTLLYEDRKLYGLHQALRVPVLELGIVRTYD